MRRSDCSIPLGRHQSSRKSGESGMLDFEVTLSQRESGLPTEALNRLDRPDFAKAPSGTLRPRSSAKVGGEGRESNPPGALRSPDWF